MAQSTSVTLGGKTLNFINMRFWVWDFLYQKKKLIKELIYLFIYLFIYWPCLSYLNWKSLFAYRDFVAKSHSWNGVWLKWTEINSLLSWWLHMTIIFWPLISFNCKNSTIYKRVSCCWNGPIAVVLGVG